MDEDIYFTDKNKRPSSADDSQSRRIVSDEFLDTNYFDEKFDLKFKKQISGQAFSSKAFEEKNENLFSQPASAQSRTPQGKPVSQMDSIRMSSAGFYDNTGAEAAENTKVYTNEDIEYTRIMKNSVLRRDDENTGVYSSGAPAIQEEVKEMARNQIDNTENGRQPVNQSRVPQGRPVQQRAAQTRSAQSRAPQGRPAQQRTSQRASAQSRTPQGTRVRQTASHEAVRKQRVSSPPPKKSLFSKRNIIIGVLVLILCLFVSLFAYAYHTMGGLDYDDTIVPNAYVDERDLVSSKSVTNILFLGCDGREDVSGDRSDTMILFSIDKQNKKIKLTSFLRDSLVYIPSKGYNTKLNASFSYGGAQLVMDTIEYNFGVDIDYYIMVDFTAFKTIVNLLGGITVEGVTAAEAKYMKEVVKIKSQDIVEGTNEMSGNTALWYCRIRHIDSDFKRTERQRKVISAIISKALKTDIFTLFEIVEKTVPHISTNMNRNKLLSFGISTFTKLLTYDIAQQQIPAPGTWSDGWSSGQQVLKMDMDENRAILKSFLYDKESKTANSETE